MAGYSKLYVIGGEGGFMGADGVSPIALMILVGQSDRIWFEAKYFMESIERLGSIEILIPDPSTKPDQLLDACLVFLPEHFRSCASLALVTKLLVGRKRLDLSDLDDELQGAWKSLRDEARQLLKGINIWQAELVQLN